MKKHNFIGCDRAGKDGTCRFGVTPRGCHNEYPQGKWCARPESAAVHLKATQTKRTQAGRFRSREEELVDQGFAAGRRAGLLAGARVAMRWHDEVPKPGERRASAVELALDEGWALALKDIARELRRLANARRGK